MHHASPRSCLGRSREPWLADQPGAAPAKILAPAVANTLAPGAAQALVKALATFIFLCLCLAAAAEGPRWITGPPYFSVGYTSVVWYTNAPVYYTDPGDLSPFVDHASADALVAAAASVWNIPTAAITLSQGGQLAEHVSSANVYLGSSGLVFPADVSATNYAAIQIAIVYDTDGSITDLMLGQGASDPAECRQSGVTESVDSITTTGFIRHALIVLNGRCTGPDHDQQLQLQYQLVRVFGRVLGLGWSQANDNVFTGSPAPNTFQAYNWPIMHPIDIICGNYTYQCLPEPFTLRPDDIGSLSALYPIAPSSVPPGKSPTYARASQIVGVITFPSGEGMQGINLTLRRHQFATNYDDPGDVVSTISGTLFRWNNGNVVTGQLPNTTLPQSLAASMGANNGAEQGRYFFTWIPLIAGQPLDDALITSEPINPLYSGAHAVGPYPNGPVAPSGTYFVRDNGVHPYSSNFFTNAPTGAATCSFTGQGTASSPATVAASGFWTGGLCTWGAVAWPGISIAANRTFTLEVTALDEQSNPTTTKLQPLLGVWNRTDATNVLPTVAAAQSPFNALALGMTSLTTSITSASNLRLAIADVRGDGRPDYLFHARLLYAATVSPAAAPPAGGPITITGMGFRPGCQLTLNGVSIPVLTSTANTLVAVAPPFPALGSGTTTALDLVVTDPTTGGSSTMSAALSYPTSAIPTVPQSIVTLTPQIYIPASLPVTFLEQAVATAASTALPNLPVTWAANPPAALSFSNAAATIPSAGTLATLTTPQGIAATAATIGPIPAGTSANGTACITSTLCATFTATAVDPAQWTPVPILNTQQTVPSTGVLLPVLAQITDLAGHPIVGAPAIAYQTVTAYEPPCPPTGACPIPATIATTQTPLLSDANGLVLIQPLQIGQSPQTLHLAIATGTQSLLALTLQKTP